MSKVEFCLNNSINKTTNDSPSILLFFDLSVYTINRKVKIDDNIKEFLETNIDIDERHLELI